MSLQLGSLYDIFINQKGNWRITANKIDKKNNKKPWVRQNTDDKHNRYQKAK